MAISAASIQNQINRAFAAMGDLVTSFTYRYPSAYGRNARYEQEITWASVTVRGIVTQFTAREIAAAAGAMEIGVDDRKVYVSRKGLTVDIKTTGEFIIDGKIYNIANVQTDPAGAVYLVTATDSGDYIEPEPEPEPDPEP